MIIVFDTNVILAGFLTHGASAKVADLLRYLRQQLEVIEPSTLASPACRDPDDDMILATAVAARANCIVNGDNDLLDMKQYQQIPIIKPAEFWRFEVSFRKS